jgi:hypothetical protein
MNSSKINRHQQAAQAISCLLLLVIALVCQSAELVQQKQKGVARVTKTVAKTHNAAIGFVDSLSYNLDGYLVLSGWALSAVGVARAELVLNHERRILLTSAIPREDVLLAHPNYPDSPKAGFEAKIDTSSWPSGLQTLDIAIIDKLGRETVINKRTLASPVASTTWSELLNKRGLRQEDIFYFVMATSSIAKRGAEDIDTTFRPYESDTVKVGFRVPILYLRTTKGTGMDYAFDPDFPNSRMCGTRTIADDNLNSVIAYAVAQQLPVMFTLNGGIWGDASCDVPEWDINDVLEADIANCQWNEKKNSHVMPDDYLKNLSGSLDSPELGRALTFNVYAAKNRSYKKRNLQEAGTIISQFAKEHPSLFIGVNLDPDLYINPFFEGQQWYDYNPNTLRQFREWVSASGPYAGEPAAGVPDLSRFRRKNPLTLSKVNALSGANFQSWDAVEPPRSFSDGQKPFANDLWVTEWDHFRRHLVDLHYDELSEWIGEVGIGREYIYSSQGFMAPSEFIDPFPVYINSPGKNYDTGGMSIEGAIPSNGHLGAILYGRSAVNKIKMEGKQSLFSTFRKLDPGWAVVEHNTADLRNPKRMPDFSEGYRSIRDIYNYGARFISPMAWNGSSGIFSGKPGFVSYTALRDTPLETAIKEFMITHHNLPRSARLWTFGSGNHADDDGWSAVAGSKSVVGKGNITLQGNSQGNGSLESPDDIWFRPGEYHAILVKIDAPEKSIGTIAIEGQAINGKWEDIVQKSQFSELTHSNAGYVFLLGEKSGNSEYRKIRLNWTGTRRKAFILKHIAFYPKYSTK